MQGATSNSQAMYVKKTETFRIKNHYLSGRTNLCLFKVLQNLNKFFIIRQTLSYTVFQDDKLVRDNALRCLAILLLLAQIMINIVNNDKNLP